MWTPRERIRHPLPAARWPTLEEASQALWFRPIRIGPIELRERTWVPAMVPWRATEDGFVTESNLRWYERFACGKPGAIVVEATGIRDIPSGPLLRIGHDRFLPGLERLVETVRRASGGETKLFIQILDFLSIKRRPTKENYFRRFLGLGGVHRQRLARATGETRWLEVDEKEVRERLLSAADEELDRILDARELEDLRFGARERVGDLHLPHIRELPRVLPAIFADAAERARSAGFDGVELQPTTAISASTRLSLPPSRATNYLAVVVEEGGPKGPPSTRCSMVALKHRALKTGH